MSDLDALRAAAVADPEVPEEEGQEPVEPTREQLETIAEEFVATLELALDQDHVRALVQAGFVPELEALVNWGAAETRARRARSASSPQPMPALRWQLHVSPV